MKNKRAVKVLFSIPEMLLLDVDGLADQEQRSRSELIREALRRYINQNLKNVEPVT